MPVYADLGVKRVINAWGPMTIIGSALVRPEVIAAMAEAAESYVDVIELQHVIQRADVVDAEFGGGPAAAFRLVVPDAH